MTMGEHERVGFNALSHGLPGKTFVHENIQFYCVGCGHPLIDDLRQRTLIYCPNPECEKRGWKLLRPDLRSVDIIQEGKEESDVHQG